MKTKKKEKRVAIKGDINDLDHRPEHGKWYKMKGKTSRYFISELVEMLSGKEFKTGKDFWSVTIFVKV